MLPRFSLRVALLLFTAAALLAVVAASAVQGEVWAIGACVGVASLGVTLMVHAAFYALVWLFSPRGGATADESSAVEA